MLFKNDIQTLKKSAINFLYIFVDPRAQGLAPDILRKRQSQLNELTEIAKRNPEYSARDLINFIRLGLAERYGKTPGQLLQTIYNAALPVHTPGVGSGALSTPGLDPGRPKALAEAADRVKNLSLSVNDKGTTTKKNVWKDVLTVLEWLVALLSKIFGAPRDPRVYAPSSGDWTGGNAPSWQGGNTQTAGFGMGGLILPTLAVTGVLFYLFKNGKIRPLQPKLKKNKTTS